MTLENDNWDVLTLRVRVKNKEKFNAILKTLGVTQDDFIKQLIDDTLRKIALGREYVNDKNTPYANLPPKIVKEILAYYGK